MGLKKDASTEQLKSIAEVRDLIKSVKWCKEVHIFEQTENKGLADSIIDGVTEIVNKYGKIIVLEDDLITSKGFLRYMNDALDLYKHEEKVMHISGYMFPVKVELPETFFLNMATCWGWGTWKTAWSKLDLELSETHRKLLDNPKLLERFDIGKQEVFSSQVARNLSGEIKTWAVKWYSTIFFENGFSLHPKQSLVKNIGTDGSGENFNFTTDEYYISEVAQRINTERIPIVESQVARNATTEFYDKNAWKKSFIRQLAEVCLPEKIVAILSRFRRRIFKSQNLKKETIN